MLVEARARANRLNNHGGACVGRFLPGGNHQRRGRAGPAARQGRVDRGNWPIHGAGLMLRTAALRALGGWAGLPVDEDLCMFAGLSQIADGHNFDGVTWLYRQHPNQTTRSVAKRHLSEASRRFALQRARAVRIADLNFGARAESLSGSARRMSPSARRPKSHAPSSAPIAAALSPSQPRSRSRAEARDRIRQLPSGSFTNSSV
jgi:hypothetical protein